MPSIWLGPNELHHSIRNDWFLKWLVTIFWTHLVAAHGFHRGDVDVAAFDVSKLEL